MEAEPRKPAAEARRRDPKPGSRSHGFKVLEDISAITARSEDLQETLQRIVEVVAERAGTDVCSLYILDQRAQRLTLWATPASPRGPSARSRLTARRASPGWATGRMEPGWAV